MPVVVAAVVAVAGSAMSARSSSRAAGRASRAQTDAANQANQTTRDSFSANAMLQDPFRQGGLTAYNQYLQMMGMAPVQTNNTSDVLNQYGFGTNGTGPGGGTRPGGEDMLHDGIVGNYAAYQSGEGPSRGIQPFGSPSGSSPALPTTGFNAQQVLDTIRATPGYQFGLDQGNRQVEASAAARGGLNSGATLRALQRYGTDYADQQGYTPYMNRLAGLFGGAQQVSQNLGGAAMDAGRQIGANQINAGNARAGMYQAQGQAQAGMWGGIANAIGGAIGGSTAGQNGYFGNNPGRG